MLNAFVLGTLLSVAAPQGAATSVHPAGVSSNAADPGPPASGADASSTGDPRGSALYANHTAASAVLDRAIAAHGGKRWVENRLSYSFNYEGHELLQAHLQQPWAHLSVARRGRYRYGAEFDALRTEGVRTLNSDTEHFALLSRETGICLDVRSEHAAELSAGELAERWRNEESLLPHAHLREASANLATLRLLAADGTRNVLSFTRASGESRALILNGASHLLERVEDLRHWDSKGDRLDWMEFSQYAEIDGVMFAERVRSHREAATTQTNFDMRLSGIAAGQPSQLDDFKLPAEHAEAFPGFAIEPRSEDQPNDLPSHALGHGVYALDAASTNARVILVEFEDHLVAIESGGTSEVGAQVLQTASHLFPHKPVRYLAMSHHHRISASGIRPYVQQGVTLLVTTDNVEYVRDLAARPYRLRPDRQQESPSEVQLEVVEGRRIFEDPTQRLELHEFHTSGHTDDYVFSYVPALKFGTVGDLLYLPEGPLRPAGGRTRALCRLIQDLGLDVEFITQTWPLESNYLQVPMQRLLEQVRLANEHSPR